jgi:carbonic anhydrase
LEVDLEQSWFRVNRYIESELVKGNKDFVNKVDKSFLKALSENGQTPRAVVIACSDSRVPVELIFNVSLPGTLFVIRVAGNIISGPVVEGSVEFAIRQLRTPFVVLLGHTGCGAVQACIDRETGSKSLAQMLSSIKIVSGEIGQAVIENLDYQFRNLLNLECIQEKVNSGELVAYSMVYELCSGQIIVRNKSCKNRLQPLFIKNHSGGNHEFVGG